MRLGRGQQRAVLELERLELLPERLILRAQLGGLLAQELVHVHRALGHGRARGFKLAAQFGVLQGIGQTASASAQGITGADGLDQSLTSIAGASAAGALGGGISNAADTLAQYYIQRAEQYQPVVSLYGGTSVEVVFLDGVDLR